MTAIKKSAKLAFFLFGRSIEEIAFEVVNKKKRLEKQLLILLNICIIIKVIKNAAFIVCEYPKPKMSP